MDEQDVTEIQSGVLINSETNGSCHPGRNTWSKEIDDERYKEKCEGVNLDEGQLDKYVFELTAGTYINNNVI